MEKVQKNKKEKNRLKNIFIEIRDSLFVEVIWRILVFLPRLLARAIKEWS